MANEMKICADCQFHHAYSTDDGVDHLCMRLADAMMNGLTRRDVGQPGDTGKRSCNMDDLASVKDELVTLMNRWHKEAAMDPRDPASTTYIECADDLNAIIECINVKRPNFNLREMEN